MIIGVGGLQLFLDQGQSHNWFQSNSILLLFICMIFALIAFISRSWRRKDAVVKLQLLQDRNLSVSSILLMLYCASFFGIASIQPILLQRLYGYPVILSGLVSAPRGIACAISMFCTPMLIKRFGVKPLLIIGAILSGFGFYTMSHYNLIIGIFDVTWPGAVQGFGMGLFFVPLATVSLANFSEHSRASAAGIYSYSRMLGTSIGISIVSTLIARERQINWHHFSSYMLPRAIQLAARHYRTLPLLHNTVERYSTMVAFMDVYYLASIAFMVLLPIILLLKPSAHNA